MIAVPHELMAAHIVFDDSDEPAASRSTWGANPARCAGRNAVREAQRALGHRRFRAGWAALNPGLAPALRRGR